MATLRANYMLGKNIEQDVRAMWHKVRTVGHNNTIMALHSIKQAKCKHDRTKQGNVLCYHGGLVNM